MYKGNNLKTANCSIVMPVALGLAWAGRRHKCPRFDEVKRGVRLRLRLRVSSALPPEARLGAPVPRLSTCQAAKG